MAFSSGRQRGKTLRRLATALVAAAVLGGTAGTAVAAPAPVPAPLGAEAAAPSAVPFAASAGTGEAPVFPLMGVETNGDLYSYGMDGQGGLTEREYVWFGWEYFKNAAWVDNDRDGESDGLYSWDNSGMLHFSSDGGDKQIGGGWNIYTKVLSPGDLGGAKEYDIMAVDTAGVMWTYLAYPDGSVTPRVRIGSGWDAYTHLSGKGDLTGDGRADIVAKDGKGDLYLYKGTGDYKAPFEPRVKVGYGYNIYNALLSTGDVDLDGRTDMLAREANGDLYLYKGTGNASDPFESRKKIGFGYNIYRWMF
ncbi:FG-GAP repeat domain-containing protein [Streptomyces sp. URMC 123]|uniref:FG-GAP repeat domain-containing protein n=1 Tax=Streptomyces sp. URMC 123 TaxID=3423403 RepID=UPI003F1C7390